MRKHRVRVLRIDGEARVERKINECLEELDHKNETGEISNLSIDDLSVSNETKQSSMQAVVVIRYSYEPT